MDVGGAVEKGGEILEKVQQQGFLALTLLDYIFIAGAIALVIVALKVVSKFFKVVLFVLAVVLVLVVLHNMGWLPF
jgi:hypothetical protein